MCCQLLGWVQTPHFSAKAHCNLDTQCLFSWLSYSCRREFAAPFKPVSSLFSGHSRVISVPFALPSWRSQDAFLLYTQPNPVPPLIMSTFSFLQSLPRVFQTHPPLFSKLLLSLLMLVLWNTALDYVILFSSTSLI